MISDSMRVFITVADKKNFSKAAKSLSLTQPAVSFQIQTLEQYYQTMLFDRVNRHVKLTAAGDLLLDYAKHMSNLQAELEKSMQELTGHVKGELLVGASTTIGEYVLPYIAGGFKKEYPDVNITIQVMNTEEVGKLVFNNTLDMGLIEGPVQENDDVGTYEFLEDELILLAPIDHPWAEKKVININQLSEEQFIIREAGSGTRQVIEQSLTDAGFDVSSLNIVMELGNTTAIKSAIMSGLGVSIISKWAAKDIIRMGKVAPVAIEDLEIKRKFRMIFSDDKFQSQATNKFIAYLHKDSTYDVLER